MPRIAPRRIATLRCASRLDAAHRFASLRIALQRYAPPLVARLRNATFRKKRENDQTQTI
jgi:hypothetical protein